MPANFGVTSKFGLTPPTGGVVEESSTEDEIEAKTIKDETGTTCRAVPGKTVKTTVTIKGKGLDMTTAVAAGAMVAGTVKVTSIKNSESNDDFPTFETTGVKYTSLTQNP
ncbi:MAG: hypothetical protein ACFUZC_16930 [Chthoniobacteraceae bacterium]